MSALDGARSQRAISLPPTTALYCLTPDFDLPTLGTFPACTIPQTSLRLNPSAQGISAILERETPFTGLVDIVH